MGALFNQGVGTGVDAAISARGSQLQWRRTKRAMQNRHQWEVADLKAAGLNPILSAGGTPSLGNTSTPHKTEFGSLAATGMQAKRLKSELLNMSSQRGLTDELARKAVADTIHSTASAELQSNQSHESILRQMHLGLQTGAIRNQADLEQWKGKYGTRAEFLLNILGPAVAAGVGGGLGARVFGRKPPKAGRPNANTPRGGGNRQRRRHDGRVPNRNPAPYVGPEGRLWPSGYKPHTPPRWKSAAPYKGNRQ